MILLDVNVLVYAHRNDMDQHEGYADWITRVGEGAEPFALGAGPVAGFLRVVTNPRVFTDPTMTETALAFVEGLRESPMCRWVEPGDRWWSIFAGLCHSGGARGNLVPDAQLAAVAIEHGCRLATADRGFARFPGLQWFHPLALDS